MTVAAPPGSTLALYTDGLVETPESDIETRVGVLAETLRQAFAATRDLELAADYVLDALLPPSQDHNDDVTLLLVRLPEPALATASYQIPAEPAAVSEGRRFLSGVLGEWGCGALVGDAQLLVSEVLTNAIQHARGPLRLRLRRTARELTVEVADRSHRLPQPRLADTADESGRGLILVESLASSWGAHPTDDGKTIWFTLPLPLTGRLAPPPVPGALAARP